MSPEELDKYNFRSQVSAPELTPNRSFKEKVLIERVNQTVSGTPSETILTEPEKKPEVKDFTKSAERKDRTNL